MEVSGILVGTDAGLRRLDGRSVPGPEGKIEALAAGDDVWWAIERDGTLWRGSGDECAAVARVDGDRPQCLVAAPDGVVVGTTRAGLHRWDGETLRRVVSFDEAPGRDSWYTPWGGPPDVRSAARDPKGRYFLNVHVGGVVRGDEDLTGWTDTMDIHHDVHQVVAHPDRADAVFVAAAVGFGASFDGGETWEFTAAGLDASYCRAVAVTGDTAFVSASRGPHGARAALYRKRIGDDEFRRCADGLPDWFSENLNTGCLVVSPESVVAGDRNGTVYGSTDLGDSWATIGSGLPPIHCLIATG